MLHTGVAHSFAVLAGISHLSACAVPEPIPVPLAVFIQDQELTGAAQKHIPVAWHVRPGYAM